MPWIFENDQIITSPYIISLTNKMVMKERFNVVGLTQVCGWGNLLSLEGCSNNLYLGIRKNWCPWNFCCLFKCMLIFSFILLLCQLLESITYSQVKGFAYHVIVFVIKTALWILSSMKKVHLLVTNHWKSYQL